jgi:hypothetical protein
MGKHSTIVVEWTFGDRLSSQAGLGHGCQSSVIRAYADHRVFMYSVEKSDATQNLQAVKIASKPTINVPSSTA